MVLLEKLCERQVLDTLAATQPASRRMLPFDYEYVETDTEVTVTVQLGTAPRRGLDLYGTGRERCCTRHDAVARHPCAITDTRHASLGPCFAHCAVSDALVKVYAPGGHLLALDLHGLVNDATAKAVVGDHQVVFTLAKLVPGLWGRLTAQGDKQALAARRQESVERAAQRHASARAQAAARLKELTLATEEAAQAADRAVRLGVDTATQAELDGQRAALAAWSHGAQGQAGMQPVEDDGDGEAAATAAPLPPPCDAPALPPRAPMRVIVTHTQLKKPGLPARAPTAEKDGGAVDADALSRRNGVVPSRVLGTDAVDASERHPIFLCDKADTLAAAGAWDAAENAFSAALQLQPSHQPTEVAASAAPSLRARALRGRAACRRHLGDDGGAVADLEAARTASMDGQTHSEWRCAVDAELAAARADCSLTPDELRQRGDTLAGAGKVDMALSFYQRALARGDADADGLRVQVATYTNRAALWLKRGQLAVAESDVRAALQLVFGSTDVAGDTVVAEVIADTEQARQCGGSAALSRLLARRAGIRAKQHRFADAAADARAAAALRRRDGELDVAAALEADASLWSALLT